MNSTVPLTDHQQALPVSPPQQLSDLRHDSVDIPQPDHQLSDTSDDDDLPTVTTPPRRLSKKLKIFITASLALVFLITMVFTVRNWTQYEDRRSEYEWTKHSCTIVSSPQVVAETRDSDKFRIEAQVNGLPSRPSETVDAYYGPTPAYTMTEANATEVQSRLPTKDRTTSCWEKRSGLAVSLKEENGSEEEMSRARSALFVAWTTTFIAAVVGMFLLIFASHWLSDFAGSALASGGGNDGDEITSPEEIAKSKPYLSSAQAKHVCNSFYSEVKREQNRFANWTCSVCLDEDEDVSTIRTVLLPCEHRFHRQCIKKWLRRGKGACPLCNWDARALFDEGEGEGEGEASPGRAEMEGGDEGRESQETGGEGEEAGEADVESGRGSGVG